MKKMDGIERKAFQEMEAVREMIERGNHVAARDKLLKLQQQFPAIDEFMSMICVCDVLNSAKFDFLDSETDWYLVLQVPQAASEQDVEYQYNKISTLIKPIKHHHFFPAAAESALNIIKEAYSVLSNPEKRSVFDKKRTTMFETSDNQYEFSDRILTHRFAEGDNMDDTFELDHYAENNKRDLKDLACNQIWAIRDDDDPEAMPRRYVVMKNKGDTDMYVTFLEPNPMCADEKQWVERGLPLACGSFKEGKSSIVGLHQFCHMVKCERSRNDSSSYWIYPKKGEVWAMYRNWNCKWEQSDFTNCCQYQIVEIIEDLSDDGSDILVASLVEVLGLMTFFQRQRCNGFELIPRAAFISFSHRIEASRVQETENDNGILTPFWQLEPHSLGFLNVNA